MYQRNPSLVKQTGQGMTEYIIIVALIAIAAIGVATMFGQTIHNQIAGMAKEVAGEDSSTQVTQAQTAAGTANTRANNTKGLATYGSDNDHQ